MICAAQVTASPGVGTAASMEHSAAKANPSSAKVHMQPLTWIRKWNPHSTLVPGRVMGSAGVSLR